MARAFGVSPASSRMARAIDRCGALLKEIEPKQGANQNIRDGADPKVTRKQAAKDAGMSEHQQGRPNFKCGPWATFAHFMANGLGNGFRPRRFAMARPVGHS